MLCITQISAASYLLPFPFWEASGRLIYTNSGPPVSGKLNSDRLTVVIRNPIVNSAVKIQTSSMHLDDYFLAILENRCRNDILHSTLHVLPVVQRDLGMEFSAL